MRVVVNNPHRAPLAASSPACHHRLWKPQSSHSELSSRRTVYNIYLKASQEFCKVIEQGGVDPVGGLIQKSKDFQKCRRQHNLFSRPACRRTTWSSSPCALENHRKHCMALRLSESKDFGEKMGVGVVRERASCEQVMAIDCRNSGRTIIFPCSPEYCPS